MKRYFIVKEYFGIRVYDTKYKKEYYFNNNVAKEIEKILKQDCKYINKTMDNTISSPLKISMNLTKKCNLRCIQCFSNSGKIENNELKTEDIYKLFDDMVENGTFFICLGGGEPFTRKDLFSILEYGKKKQIAI